MKGEKNAKYEIQKLSIFNGKNFSNWKFRIQILMKEHGVESFVTKSTEEHADIVIGPNDSAEAQAEKNKKKEELTKKENKCHSMIIQRICDEYLEYVKDKATPKEVWSTLIATFERKGMANRMFLRRKLLKLEMTDNEDLESHLLNFNTILRDLKSAGAKMEDEDVICQLLLSLPKTYDPVVTAIETMKTEELTIEFVKGRLLDDNIKRKTNNTGEDGEMVSKQIAMTGVVKKDVICYLCGKRGHYKSECKLNNSRQSHRNHRESYMAHIDYDNIDYDNDEIAF